MLNRTFFLAVALLLTTTPGMAGAALSDTEPPAVSEIAAARAAAARAAAARIAAARENMAGTWQVTWPCDKSTVLLEHKCNEGVRDGFTLRVLVKGSALCALHEATAKMGDRVDKSEGPEPSITGQFDGTSAKVVFSSSWEAKGTASLTWEGKNLKWNILSQNGGRHWLPAAATLMKIPNSTWGNNLKCLP